MACFMEAASVRGKTEAAGSVRRPYCRAFMHCKRISLTSRQGRRRKGHRRGTSELISVRRKGSRAQLRTVHLKGLRLYAAERSNLASGLKLGPAAPPRTCGGEGRPNWTHLP